jgi:mono/diheme cytochrome c family protein
MKAICWAVVCLGVWGCGGDGSHADDILALDADLDNGADVYAARCQECHATDGSAIEGSFPLAGKDLRADSQEKIVDTILNPPAGMLDFSVLTDQEIADVSAHAESL